MLTPRSRFLTAFCERGYLHQCTDLVALDAALCSGPMTAYIGFDCTAPSLHVGSLLQIMTLRLLQRTGHKPIVLMGGGTTKVGDPSGKEAARPLLDEAAIAANMAGIRQVFAKFLRFGSGPTDALMVDNAEWLDKLPYIAFLRDFGRHFSVSRMLSMESVKLRLEREQPLSFLEFNYMVLQAYDYLELARRYGCHLQLGGSDQWGNIVHGVELARRVDERAVFGLTTPLITTAGGAKMGKTAQGAVWLSAEALEPYDYWQFWRNVEDADVGRFLRLFTELPLAEIVQLETLSGAALNEAKKRLATAATTLCHGAVAAAVAEETARLTFELGAAGAALPTVSVPRAELNAGLAAFELLHRTKLTASLGESRRMIKGGGLRINDVVVANELHVVTLADVGPEGFIKISAGRKRHAIVRPD